MCISDNFLFIHFLNKKSAFIPIVRYKNTFKFYFFTGLLTTPINYFSNLYQRDYRITIFQITLV